MEKDTDQEKIPFIDDTLIEIPQATSAAIKDAENDGISDFPQANISTKPDSDEMSKEDVLDVSLTGTNSKCISPSTEKVSHSRENSFKFPIHAAAEKGNVKTLARLLDKGDPLVTDFKGRSPLHYACGFAYQKKALRMIDVILKSPQAQNTPDDNRKKRLIDMQDKNGETGLHIGARTGHPQLVEKLLFAAADVNIKDKGNVEPLELIYHKVPQSMQPVFDMAVECKVGDPSDQNLTVRMDFGSIVGYPEPENTKAMMFDMETKLLSYCLQQSEKKRSAIMLHPIVQVFLHLKWKKIRILLWISILYHVIWLLLYTLFITDLYLMKCPYVKNAVEHEEENDRDIENITDQSIETDIDESFENATETNATNVIINATTCKLGEDLLSSININLACLFFVSMSVALKELYEICSTPQLKLYFVQLENVGQWLLLGVVGLTSLPLFATDSDNIVCIYSWQYQVAALGIFLAWSLILCQIGKIPRFGIYIEMLGKVLKSFIMFMITFASILVAFTVSFQILMPEKPEFQSFPWGFMKIMIMMVGELNYDDLFHAEESDAEIPFPETTKLLYLAFVSVITIMLFNLLIGLTVSDTQGLTDGAQLTSLSSQLDQIYLMEKFIFSKKMQTWLRAINKAHWLRYFLVTQQTDDKETNMGIDIHISKIPRDLQHPVRDVAIPNETQEDDEDEDEDNTDSPEKSISDVTPSDAAPNKDNITISIADLREQIRDVLREVLEELQNANPRTNTSNQEGTSI